MQTFSIRKHEVRSSHGLVSAQNRLAAEAGAAVLARGGNAMDAAVTTALTLSVVEPWLSGVGGGGFLLRADASGAVDALDFNVVAARGLDPADYPLGGADAGNWFAWPSVVDDRNVSGYSSMAVPGAVAGLSAALERFGTIAWADALAPAIEHAERGLEIDWFACLSFAVEAAGLAKHPSTAALFLDEGRAPKAGDAASPNRKPMPNKARLLRRLAQAGARDFYEGETARLIARDLAEGGSKITETDLAAYRPQWREPLRGQYRGVEINAISGLSGGPSYLEAAAELEGQSIDPASAPAEAALAYAVAIRSAYERRLTTMGHAATPEAGCTSHFSVVDSSGTMVSLTNTLLSRFGSRVVLPNAGFLMNNGVMWFDPRPGQPNAMAPGAKPLANMCPLILRRDGQPWFALGAAGGRTIFPTLLQIMSHVVDGGMSLEEAFHWPRLDASTPTIRVNKQAAPGTAELIGARFHVEAVEDTVFPTNFAIASAVMRTSEGENVGMAHQTSPWAAVAVGEPA